VARFFDPSAGTFRESDSGRCLWNFESGVNFGSVVVGSVARKCLERVDKNLKGLVSVVCDEWAEFE